MRMLRALLVSLTLALGGVLIPPVVVPSAAVQATAGVTMTSHRYVYSDPVYGTGWVTDYWDYERVGYFSFMNYLYTVPGYW